MPDDPQAEIDRFIAEHGVTKCPDRHCEPMQYLPNKLLPS